MGPTYNPDETNVHPYDLTPRDFAAIGRLVHCCANLETIIDYHLSDVSGMSTARLLLVLGRASTTSKLKIAERFAKAAGDPAWKNHKASFLSGEYREVVKCRNTVAHGALQGRTEHGIVFLVSDVVEFDGEAIEMTVRTYPVESIEHFADLGESLVTRLSTDLNVPASRRRPVLRTTPHPKARKPNQQGG